MDRKQLDAHIKELTALKATDAPVLSCYLDLTGGSLHAQLVLFEQFKDLRGKIHAEKIEHLEGAVQNVQNYLKTHSLAGCSGLALFSRAGSRPFFLAVKLNVDIQARISFDDRPNVVRLVAMKEKCERSVQNV